MANLVMVTEVSSGYDVKRRNAKAWSSSVEGDTTLPLHFPIQTKLGHFYWWNDFLYK